MSTISEIKAKDLWNGYKYTIDKVIKDRLICITIVYEHGLYIVQTIEKDYCYETLAEAKKQIRLLTKNK